MIISPGSHASEEAVNKQLADKERVAAALENSHLLQVVNQCLVDKQKDKKNRNSEEEDEDSDSDY